MGTSSRCGVIALGDSIKRSSLVADMVGAEQDAAAREGVSAAWVKRGLGVTGPRWRRAWSQAKAPRATTTWRSRRVSSAVSQGAQASRSLGRGLLSGGAHLTGAVM